jgi:Tfp pilus assembly protein PilV
MSSYPSVVLPPGSRRPDDGFTLLEVIIAFFMLLLVLIPTAQFLSDQSAATGNLRNRVVASNLVDQMMEKYEAESVTSFSALESGSSGQAVPNGPPVSTTQTVGSIRYTLTTTEDWQETGVDSGCDSNGNGSDIGSSALLFIEASVSWEDMDGTPPISATTTIAQPYTSDSSTTGSLELSVTGANGTGADESGVAVVLTDNDTGSSTTQYLNTDGCLFVPNLTPTPLRGKGYTFELQQAGYVTPLEGTTYSQSGIDITGGAVTSESANYDVAGTIDASYSGGIPPVGMPITVANTSLIPSGTYVFSGTTSLTPLYPYPNGYSVWAGDCPDSNPAAENRNTNTALYPSAPAAPVGTPTADGAGSPGPPVTVTVPLTTLNVTVYGSNGAAASGATVEVTAAADPNTTACNDANSYQLSGTTSAGGTVTAGMPLGYFTVSALTSSGALIGSTTVDVEPGTATSAVIGSPSSSPTSVPASTTTTSTTAPPIVSH